jgi:hypothetical protein
MTQAEIEKLRAKLEAQLRADVEVLYEAHRVKLRAFETIWRAQADLGRDEVPAPSSRMEPRPVLTLPAGPPPPPPAEAPGKKRGQAWALLDAIEDAFADLPEEFDKNDLIRAIGYEPNRATLARALDTLRQEGWIAITERGAGKVPTRYRKAGGAPAAASGDTDTGS